MQLADRMIHRMYKFPSYSNWAVSLCPVLLSVIPTIQNLIVSHCMDVLLILAYSSQNNLEQICCPDCL